MRSESRSAQRAINAAAPSFWLSDLLVNISSLVCTRLHSHEFCERVIGRDRELFYMKKLPLMEPYVLLHIIYY